VKSQNQKKITPQKGLKSQNSFTISNSVIQLPDYLDKQKIISRQGIRIVSTNDNNLFPQKVSKLSKESSTLKAIINSFSDYVSYGSILTDNAKLDKKLKEDLNKYYNWEELSKRVSKDRRTYGYGFIESVKIGSDVFIYHIDASKVRFVEYDGEHPTHIAISKDWNDSRIKPVERSLYPEYDEDNRTIISIMEYESGSNDYPLPVWSGAFFDAQVESLIGQYNANQFENGVTLSSILMFDFGDVTDAEELKKQKYKLEQNLKGTSGGNSGKSLIVPTIGDVEPPKYVQYPMEKEGSFLDLQKMVENNIIKACSWFRSLAGLESAGSLGNNQQLRNEWELAERLIRNEQDAIMSAVMKAFEGTTYVGEVDFNNQSPMNVVNDIASITTLLQNKNSIGVEAVNELLLMMGLDNAQATIISQAKNVSNDSE
tara:strand:- start:850 stop:2133 length:1284 start_codon:yes stop_codon:yes gene_type:complete